MDDTTPFGRFGSLGKPKSATKSWWLGLDRDALNQAIDRESDRMNRTFRGDNGHNRVVATKYGKV